MKTVAPVTRQGTSNLIKALRDKIAADGSTGECYAFNAAQGINLATDYSNSVLAVGHEATHFIKFRAGEKNNAQADKVFKFMNTVSRGIAGELKDLNAPLFTDSNDYGFDFNESGKNDFPTKLEDQVTLFQNINAHYLTFATGTCPIERKLVSKGWVMATIASSVAAAVTQKALAAQNHIDAKTETGLANSKMATAEINMHKIIDFLHGRHEDDTRALGDYGIDTSDAPDLERAQLSNVPIGVDKKLQHIVFGGTMTNMTGDPIIVFKGKVKRGLGVTIPGHGELAMTKGYSNAIVTTPSTSRAGMVKTITKR